jgi:hypothetical protein
MDQRIESFLGDVLALAGEEPDAVSATPPVRQNEVGDSSFDHPPLPGASHGACRT